MNSVKNRLFSDVSKIPLRPGLIFGLIILTALFAFEMFNYSTTEFALRDLLGDMRFAGISWATILTIAFCGIDFAGIARLFNSQQGNDKSNEVWYLFGAWLLAATMNAFLTWWGVSMAITNHTIQSSTIVNAASIITIVPIFVAIMVWLIRILIIGTISMAGEHLFAGSFKRSPEFGANPPYRQNRNENTGSAPAYSNRPSLSRSSSPAEAAQRAEPSYQSMSLSSPSNSLGRNGSSAPRRM
jgi:hypothetical protein